MVRRPGACAEFDVASERSVPVIFRSSRLSLLHLSLTTGLYDGEIAIGLTAVCPKSIFFPSSVTVGRLEYASPFPQAPCAPGPPPPASHHPPPLRNPPTSSCPPFPR